MHQTFSITISRCRVRRALRNTWFAIKTANIYTIIFQLRTVSRPRQTCKANTTMALKSQDTYLTCRDTTRSAAVYSL